MNRWRPDFVAGLGEVGAVVRSERVARVLSAPVVAAGAHVPLATVLAVEHGEPDVLWAAHLAVRRAISADADPVPPSPHAIEDRF